DRDGAERAAFAIRSALELRTAERSWDPPVMLTVASQGTGIDQVIEGFDRHLEFLRQGGGLEVRRRERLERRLGDPLRDQVWADFRGRLGDPALPEAGGRVLDPPRAPPPASA